MPGHWLLARLGKRVLRPGGLELTEALLGDLAVAAGDDVVEFAPGLGRTAKRLVEAGPRSYLGVERDEDAARWTRGRLPNAANVGIRVGSAENAGIPGRSASVVVGEAMLTMNTQAHKERIVAEASRILRKGGRYGLHELAIVPDDAPEKVKKEIELALSQSIHVGARPLTESEWRALLETSGFSVRTVRFAPMHLLEPARMVADEGLPRTLLLLARILSNRTARKRILAMRRTFRRYEGSLHAISIVAAKPD
ncbi:class I SAM-dependent methyltransferase [Hansschlegelia zhihuaiae]|uniref:Class I SAM-dependent methyltransferase n=2 Tax=Hansschlegelia zhihuaiae TaxID=405005 RepID=A0A4Q0MCB7_9HYPH|nr:class I SAM-dependent methyltransferase [Hansschlegelia zhihuaiae]